MKTFTLIIPGKPVGKERPRFNRHTGNVYTAPKTKAYEEQIAWFAQDLGITPCLTVCHLDTKWRINAHGEQELEISIIQTDEPFALSNHYPDIDNVQKTIMDGLNKIAYNDDRQVAWASIEREFNEPPKKK